MNTKFKSEYSKEDTV